MENVSIPDPSGLRHTTDLASTGAIAVVHCSIVCSEREKRFLARRDPNLSLVASWALFCRALSPWCHRSIFFSYAHGDADRYPTDLPTVPIQVSLRDTVVKALMVGLERKSTMSCELYIQMIF
jgi:hypothetical protein